MLLWQEPLASTTISNDFTSQNPFGIWVITRTCYMFLSYMVSSKNKRQNEAAYRPRHQSMRHQSCRTTPRSADCKGQYRRCRKSEQHNWMNYYGLYSYPIWPPYGFYSYLAQANVLFCVFCQMVLLVLIKTLNHESITKTFVCITKTSVIRKHLFHLVIKIGASQI